jgi:putative aldouronate transport system substrate-binding protein
MPRRIYRRDFLKVAGAFALGGIASACTKAYQPPTEAPTTAPAQALAEAPAATATPVPQAEPALPEVSLRVIFPCSPVPEDTTPFDRINAVVKDRINATVNFEMLDWSVFGEKQSLYHSSGEVVDVEFAAPWLQENYVNPAANGVYTALDDLIPQYAPSIWKRIVPSWWDAVKVNGKIYAVINEQYFPTPWGFKIRTDMLSKYNIDLDAITAYDSEEMFRLLHALGDADKENLDYPWAQLYPSTPPIWGYDPIATAGSVNFVVNFDDQSRKVLNWHETPEFLRYAGFAQRLSDEGLSQHDPLKVEHDQKVALISEGKLRFEFVIQNRPGSEEQFNIENKEQGWTWKHKTMAPVRLSTGVIAATLLAIPATSKNPDRALMFMDMLDWDPELYNLLAYGIEGTHWQWSDQQQKLVKLVEGSKYDVHSWGWMYVNQFNEYYCECGWPALGMWDIQGHQQNVETKPSVMLGFNPNPKAYEEKAVLLSSGGADEFTNKIDYVDGDAEQNVKDLIAWEKANGVDDVVAELQVQVDEWLKTLS